MISPELFAPDLMRPNRDRPGTLTLIAGIVVFSIAIVLFPLWALSGVQAKAGEPIGLSDIPQGVSVLDVNGSRVFLVRDGRKINGFDSLSPHLSSPLWWCRDDRIFFSPVTGEVFDDTGQLLFGSSATDMRKFGLDVIGDKALLRVDQYQRAEPAQPLPKANLAPRIQMVIETGTCTNHLA